MEDYGFFNYLAYVLYSPLYLAGPIITFNDFVHQQRYPQPTTSPTLVIKYGLRLLSSILTMELVLHYFYVVAISKTGHTHDSWSSDTPFQLSMIGYFNLHIIWLKLLIPWRFFRLWALVDHVDPPENMLRCMSNNYSALAFWRAWHRSFNRWIVRYIYIPFGGASRPIANMVVVFTFVALWHDLSFKLLAWGWLVVLFVIPELVCRKVFSKRRFEGRERAYRYLSGLGAVGNILMMMGANLVGFAIGVEGVRDLVRGVLGSWEGFGFVALACTALFMAAQIMFEVREGEKRVGIDLRC
jgi:D-alanyl-lipoteichoic acid acyltransferase DltB (MBOAT superfamily)